MLYTHKFFAHIKKAMFSIIYYKTFKHFNIWIKMKSVNKHYSTVTTQNAAKIIAYLNISHLGSRAQKTLNDQRCARLSCIQDTTGY